METIITDEIEERAEEMACNTSCTNYRVGCCPYNRRRAPKRETCPRVRDFALSIKRQTSTQSIKNILQWKRQ